MSDPSTKRRRLNGPSEHDESNSDSSSAENDLDENSPNSSTLPKHSRPQNGANSTNRFSDVSRATGLSKSSLFKLQTDELLAGLRPDYDKLASSVQAQLRKIRDILQQIPEQPSKRADVAAKELKDQYRVSVPYPCHSSEQELAKYHVSFQPPASIDLVGNLCLRAGSQATELSNVDIAVTIPASLFHPKDHRNYKYFQKRAFYIACIAANLRKAKLPFSMQYDYQDGDSLRPIVVLTPSNTTSEESVQRVCIRIFTAVEDDLFPVTRTLPSKNNIRTSDAEDEPQTQEENNSSPYYNSVLRFESTIIPYHKWLQNSLKKYAAMRDASLLGQTWLRQRGFESSIEKGGFGGFEWMMVLALLFEGGGANGKPVLLPSYSSYQIFKATLQFLASRDLMKPLSLFADNVEFPHGGPIFFDGKRSLNILYKMTKGSYKLLRYECTLTLSLLNETRFDNFEKIFIFRSADPMLKFDRLVSFVLQGDNVDHLNSVRFENHVYDILERSLGDRAKVICLWAESRSPQPLKSKSLYEATSQKMTIGLILNADNANQLVDHGPAAEMQEEAAAFRAFWGEKAELRRFRDGSILESVVWSDHGTVVDQILVYSLSRHLKIPQTSIKCVGDEFDQTLQRLAGPEKKCAVIFQDIRNAFQSLHSSFQNVDDIPLQIRQIQPASPLLRNTAEIQDSKHIGLASIDINLQLESSAKWPDYLDAIQVTKTAFLLRIGEALKNNGAITSYRVGLENENKVFHNRAFLDMAHTTGIRFRLRIHHEREQTLLERKLKESGLSPHFKEDVGRALFEYKRSFIHTPRITQAIQTLSSKLPLLSPTIRLVKRWFSSQLLLSHVTEEFVELLVINTFISTKLWASPSSLLSGFYRTLIVLSKWDWQREPLVIDLGSLTADDVKDIETRFQAWRNIDPAMKKVAMIIASDLDHDGVTWTLNEKPPKVVAGHITRLAKAAVEALKNQSETKDEQIKLETLLFRPSLSPYDFIIHLKDLNAKGKKHNIQQFANLKNSAANLSTIAEASSSRDIAMSYLEELQTIFGHCILFFHSASENVIAGLWKPASTSAKPLNLKIAYSTRPVLNDDSTPVNVILNKESVLNEIARLGGDLVRSVELKNV